MKALRWIARGLLDVLYAPIPPWAARWIPRFLMATPGEREWAERARERLR